MILTSFDLSEEEFERATGWAIKPEGACKGDMCVPLTGMAAFDARFVAERLRMPVVAEERHGLWALGPDAVGGRALTTAEAPDLTLPDHTGKEFRLSSLRGRKVLLLAWASW